ncbi:Ionotropic receptor [Blattella germanica]|nr:Ionotropic receptor [Blattella germanica]
MKFSTISSILKFTNCLIHISVYNITWNSPETGQMTVVYLKSRLVIDFVQNFLLQVHWTSEIAVTTSELNFTEAFGRWKEGMVWQVVWKEQQMLVNNLVLVTENVSEIERMFVNLKSGCSVLNGFWNPRADYFIYHITSSENACGLLNSKALLKSIWEKFRILNIHFMCVFYSKFSWKIQSEFTSTEYLQKELKDLKGYPLRVSMFERRPTAMKTASGEFSGVDGLVLRALAEYMNFIPIIQEPKDGTEYGYLEKTNQTFTGSLGDILYNKADFSANTRFIKDYATPDIEFTSPVMFDNLCIIVPKAELLPHWLAPFRAFTFQVFYVIFLTYLTCSIIYYTLKHSLATPISVSECLFELFPVFLSLSVVRMPRSVSEKSLLISCLAFGMIISALFQSRLVTVISKEDFAPDINTLEELAESGLSVGTRSLNLLDESPLLKNKLLLLSTEDSVIGNIAFRRNIAGMTRLSSAQIHVLEYLNNDGSPQLHIVKECLRFYALAYVVEKGSPLLKRMNQILWRLIESGLIKRWTEESVFFRGGANVSTLRVFSLEDLQLAFLLLAGGLGIAVFIFVLYEKRNLQN